MIIQNVIQNMATAITALTWQPSGNTSATSFVGGVYTGPVLDPTKGSPWCYIHDLPAQVNKSGTRGVNGETQYNKNAVIGIHVCGNYGTAGVEPEEVAARMRYGMEAIENWIKGTANLYNVGFTQGWNYTGWQQLESPDTNTEIRQLLVTNSYII